MDWYKVWLTHLVEVLASKQDPHIWYNRVTDDLYVTHVTANQPLVGLFGDLFDFCDTMVMHAVGKDACAAQATMDFCSEFISHVMQRMVEQYGYDFDADVKPVVHGYARPVLSDI